MYPFFLNRCPKKWGVPLTVIVWCLFSSSAIAEEKFSWLPNQETNIAGYKIYYGTTKGGPYPNVTDVGNPVAVNGRIYGTVSGLTCGVKYYFVCRAYNTQGLESGDSAQLELTITASVPLAPTTVTVDSNE